MPEIKHMLCPIIKAAYDRQCHEDINLLTPEDISNDVCWNIFLFVKGRTDSFHTEDEYTFTFITVLQKILNSKPNPIHQPAVLF